SLRRGRRGRALVVLRAHALRGRGGDRLTVCHSPAARRLADARTLRELRLLHVPDRRGTRLTLDSALERGLLTLHLDALFPRAGPGLAALGGPVRARRAALVESRRCRRAAEYVREIPVDGRNLRGLGPGSAGRARLDDQRH